MANKSIHSFPQLIPSKTNIAGGWGRVGISVSPIQHSLFLSIFPQRFSIWFGASALLAQVEGEPDAQRAMCSDDAC